ncbi:hypothetical protein F0P96_10080 [Hymenobacter busanensis]|uniref:Uncharacterized protein n=1 Tax=Hymenobacter busanensis TaxID=2607656 RepID=A0A7L4ZXL9_9BACT|nr:hypothetical protein [Hymenobacter busanensis]KAA9333310.1 hypothetical protein F0P96_10080 [Hymenobacter busanensis]QHJ08011.1 hypothetical protein GUY19_12230 [Hymenobacter busanensis]
MKTTENWTLPTGWKLWYEEVSNNVYKVQLRNAHGNVVETTGQDLPALLQWCVEGAADIDQQLAAVAKRNQPR